MGVLVKAVHTAKAVGRDVQTEVQKRILHYRNTKHPSTGKAPAELIMGRPPRYDLCMQTKRTRGSWT